MEKERVENENNDGVERRLGVIQGLIDLREEIDIRLITWALYEASLYMLLGLILKPM